jgi:hypothetical protein
LRDGEKLFEELSYPTEEILPTSSPKIGRIRGTPNGWAELNRQLQQLRSTLSCRSDAAIRAGEPDIGGVAAHRPEYSPKEGSSNGHKSGVAGFTADAQNMDRVTVGMR